MRVGLCDADGHCAEGRCSEVRQCEPASPTPARDRRTHEWHRHAALVGGGLAILAAWLVRRLR